MGACEISAEHGRRERASAIEYHLQAIRERGVPSQFAEVGALGICKEKRGSSDGAALRNAYLQTLAAEHNLRAALDGGRRGSA